MAAPDKGKDNKAKSGKRQSSSPSRQDLAAIRQALDEVADSEFDQVDSISDETDAATSEEELAQATKDAEIESSTAQQSTDQGWRNLSNVITGDHEPYDEQRSAKKIAAETTVNDANQLPPDEEFGDWDDELESQDPQPSSSDDWDDATTGDNIVYQAPQAPSQPTDDQAATGDYVALDESNQSNVTTGEHAIYTTGSASPGTASSARKSDAVTGDHVSYVADKATQPEASRMPAALPEESSMPTLAEKLKATTENDADSKNAFVHSNETGTFVPFDAATFGTSQAQPQPPARSAKASRSTTSAANPGESPDITLAASPDAVAATKLPPSGPDLVQEETAITVRTADGIDMTPAQRSAKNIINSKNPQSSAEFDYDTHGRIVKVALAELRLHVEYNQTTATLAPAKFTLQANNRLLASGSANADTVLAIDQCSGVVTCSYTDSGTNGQGVDQLLYIEKQYEPDGTLVIVTTNQSTKQRLAKEVYLLSEERHKLIGKVAYEYPPEAAQVRAIQVDECGRTQHIFLFANLDALQAHTPYRQEDYTYEDKNGLRTELHQAVDLSTGVPQKLSEAEKIIDLANNSTTLTSQLYDVNQKLTVHQQVKYSAAGYAEEFHYTDTVLHRELELTFDPAAHPQHFRSYDQGSDREFLCSFDENAQPIGESEPVSAADKRDLLFCQMSIEAVALRYAIDNLECGSSTDNLAPTAPRQGDAPSGTLVWNDGETLKQAKVERGTIYDAANKAFGKIDDQGKVVLARPVAASFNILDDQAAAAAFHGMGTDGQRLDLCLAQGSRPADRNEGLNGKFSNGKVSYLVIGSKMYDQDGRFIAQVDQHGKLSFAEELALARSDIKSIDQFFKLGWRFAGNENGKPRHFDINGSMSSGRIFLRQIAPAAHRPRTEKISLIVAAEHEIRLGMIIDKKTGQQIGTFIPPVDSGDSMIGGYIISGDTADAIPLADFVLAVFDVELLAGSGLPGRRIQGLSLGPEFQADLTYKPTAGGLINLQHELDVENRHLQHKLHELQTRQQEEEKAKMRAQGLGFSATDWDSEETLARLTSSGFDNVVNCVKLTAAAKAAYESAQQSADEHQQVIMCILETAQVDENSLVRVNRVSRSLGTAAKGDDLAKLKNLVDNPPHILEDLPERSDSVFGSLKLPARGELNGLIHYEIKGGRFYQKGKKEPVALLGDKPGVILWIDGHGQIYERKMKDLVGAVWHLVIGGSEDAEHVLDWVTLANGNIVSVAELRKQAANEGIYARALQEQNPNDDTLKALQRTVDLERRFNSRLDEVTRNGIPDDPKRPSHLSLSGTLAWLEAGTQAAVRAEQNRDKVSQPLTLSSPALTAEFAAKTCGTAAIGHERFKIDGGVLRKLSSDHVAAPLETSSPSLGAGYTIHQADGQQPLAGESHVLLQLIGEDTVDALRIIGLGKTRTDSDGMPIAGGLIDVKELLENMKGAKEREGLEASMKVLFDRESSNQQLNLVDFDQVTAMIQKVMKELNITVAAAINGPVDPVAIHHHAKTQDKKLLAAKVKQPTLRMLAQHFTDGDQDGIADRSADSSTTPLSEFLSGQCGDVIPDSIVDCLIAPAFTRTASFDRERSRIAQEMHLPRKAVSDHLLRKHMSFGNLLDQLLRPPEETAVLDDQEELLDNAPSGALSATASPEPHVLEPSQQLAPGTLALPVEPGLPVAARPESASAPENNVQTEPEPAEVSFADLIAPLCDEDAVLPDNKGADNDASLPPHKREFEKPEAVEPPPATDVSFEQLMAPLSSEEPSAVAAEFAPPAVGTAIPPSHTVPIPKEAPLAVRPTIKVRTTANDRNEDDGEPAASAEKAPPLPPGQIVRESETAAHAGPPEIGIAPVNILPADLSEPKTPDFSAGLWTMPDLAELHRRSIEQRNTADTELGEHLKSFKSHPFVQSKNMDEFARSIRTRIQDWDDFRNFDPTEELEWHRSSLNSALNDFVSKSGLPPIRLIIDSWMPGDAEAQYSLGNGVILMHPQDIQDARTIDISRLYHEVLHSEQDTAIIRKIALETLSQLNQLKPGKVMAEYCEQTGLKPNLVSRDWINTVVASSSEWLRTKSDHISELLRSNPNLSRDDVIDYDPELIRAAALTRSLREREESNHQLSRQYELLLFMHDQLSSHLQPHDYVENIQNNPGFRRMLFGYEWPNERSENYDRLNNDLIKAYDQEVISAPSPDAIDKFDWKHKEAVKDILFQIEEDCLNHIRARRCKHFLGIDLELEANYAAHMLVMFHASGHTGVSRLLAFPSQKTRQVAAGQKDATEYGEARGLYGTAQKLDGAPPDDMRRHDMASQETQLPAAEDEEVPATKPVAQTREYIKRFEISETLEDGFAVMESAKTSDAAGRPFSLSRGPVIVDRSADKHLAATLDSIKAKLRENPDWQNDGLRQAEFLARETNKLMSPQGVAPDGQPWRLADGRIDHVRLTSRYAAFFQELSGRSVMLGDFIAQAKQGLGGGQSEEHSIMLKLLLDDAGMTNTLVRGYFGYIADPESATINRPNHAWIEVTIGDEQFILDLRSMTDDAVALRKTDRLAQLYNRMPARTRTTSIDRTDEADENHRRHWVVYENRRWQIAKVNPTTGLLTLHRPEQRTIAPADVIIDESPLTINEKFRIRNEHGKVDSGWYYRGRDDAGNLIMYKPIGEKTEVQRAAVLPEYCLTEIQAAASKSPPAVAASLQESEQPDSR